MYKYLVYKNNVYWVDYFSMKKISNLFGSTKYKYTTFRAYKVENYTYKKDENSIVLSFIILGIVISSMERRLFSSIIKQGIIYYLILFIVLCIIIGIYVYRYKKYINEKKKKRKYVIVELEPSDKAALNNLNSIKYIYSALFICALFVYLHDI